MPEEHVDDLLDAFALGALEPDEMEAVTRHLEGCERCTTLATGANAVAIDLLYAAPPIAPPPALRARVLERIEAEAQSGQTSTMRALGSHHVEAPPAGIATGSAAPNRFFERLRGLLSPRSGEDEAHRLLAELLADPECIIWPVPSTDAMPSASGRLVGTPRLQYGVLVTSGMRPTPRHRAYQVWFLRGGQPVPNALFSVRQSGRTTSVVRTQEPLGRYDTVAITPEPASGSPAPTGPIVLAGSLAIS